jgi:hypothetical protein
MIQFVALVIRILSNSLASLRWSYCEDEISTFTATAEWMWNELNHRTSTKPSSCLNEILSHDATCLFLNNKHATLRIFNCCVDVDGWMKWEDRITLSCLVSTSSPHSIWIYLNKKNYFTLAFPLSEIISICDHLSHSNSSGNRFKWVKRECNFLIVSTLKSFNQIFD